MMPWEEYGAQAPTLKPWEEYAPLTKGEKFASGLADPIQGAAQLLTNSLPRGMVEAGNNLNNWLADKTGLVARLPAGGVDQQTREREAAYQARRSAQGESGFDGYRTLGNVFSPANAALAYATPAAATLPMRMLSGAASGAATSAINPVTEGDYWSGKTGQMTMGAGVGAAIPVAASGLSRIISPKASTNPNIDLLKSEGVRPTIGQTLGGWANALEEKAQSIPLFGDSIRRAREQAQSQFNEAAINRAVAPINQRVQGVGTEAIKEAGDKISQAYNAAKSQLGGFVVDATANTELQTLRSMARALPPKEARQFDAAWQMVQSQFGPQGQVLPQTFKQLDSKLGNDAARFGGSPDAYQKQLGDALKEMQRILTDNAMRANPQAAQALRAADTAYANLVRVEGASVAGKARDGVFTPGQLMTAVRTADKSVRDRATARGTALMQDLAGAGQSVLGNKVPDSGTAGRLLPMATGGLLAANPVGVGAALAGGALMYTSPMQGLLSGAVSSRPQSAQAIAEALRQASPSLVPLGSQIGFGLLH